MSIREDRPDAEGDAGRPQPQATRKRHRTIAAAGAAGLAAVVGVGAVLLATRDDDSVTRDTAAPAPVVVASPAVTVEPTAEIDSIPGASLGPSPSQAAVSPAASRSASARTPASRPTAESPQRVREEIEQARKQAARDGYPLRRALTPSPGAARNAAAVSEETRPLLGGGTMRVISAKSDLSGQQEMLWAADQGKPAGSARCTQNFRFAQNDKPAVRPTMLLCWRITDERSVVVLSVAPNGAPAQTQTLNALDTQWDRLG